MCTGISDILYHNEKSTLFFFWPLCICIPSYRHNGMSVAVTDNEIHSVTLYYTVTVVTPLTFLLWLCWGFWLCQFNAGSLVWGLCLLLWTEFSVWLLEFNICSLG